MAPSIQSTQSTKSTQTLFINHAVITLVSLGWFLVVSAISHPGNEAFEPLCTTPTQSQEMVSLRRHYAAVVAA